MADSSEAKALVEQIIYEEAHADEDIIIVDADTAEYSWGWAFYYNSRRYMETDEIEHALVGNAPFLVRKRNGTVFSTTSAIPFPHFYWRYRIKMLFS